MSPEVEQDGVFVVRTPSAWQLAPLPGDTPVTVGHDAVVSLLRSASATITVEALPPGTVVAPTWTWVGRVAGGMLVLEDVGGDLVHLDARDVELLDRIDGTTAIGDLVDPVSSETDRRRLARLLATGRVLVRVDSTPDDHAPDTTPTAASTTPSAPPPPATPPARTLEALLAAGRRRVRHERVRWAPVVRDRVQPIADDLAVRLRRRTDLPVPAPESGPAPAPEPLPTREAAADREPIVDPRIPVYAAWPEEIGPPLALGMLTAMARQWKKGALHERYEIRRPEPAGSFLADLATRAGPAILLCSDYVWSLNHNLELAEQAKAVNPELFVIHGGPSAPKYAADASAFLDAHGSVAQVLVRGEGEEILCELLEALEGDLHLELDPVAAGAIGGITFRDRSTGHLVRTGDRDRIVDLDALPSPYLTGEFDGIPAEAWYYCLSVETNRGCPYGCTFCDWGSSTMSRIRKFDLERVTAELEWAANVGVHTITITDANFGIMSRDVEITRRIADIRRRTGRPHTITWTAAKNTTKHLVRIMDLLIESGLTVNTSLSLQTTDPRTLEVLDRTNISTDHYVKLAADYRRRGYPLQGDLMLGLPGQTYASFKTDLQFMLDHEVMVRSWPVQMLPNSPMNAPAYRGEHSIEVDDDNLVTSTASFSEADRLRMFRFRTTDTIAERLGVLRHVMRYLQWDHGVSASDLMEHILELGDRDPLRFPLITWVFNHFDIVPTVAVGWGPFYDEVRRLVVEDFGLAEDDRALETVLRIQRALMPAPGMAVPLSVDLDHDYLAYYRSATASLYDDGHAGLPERPLAEYPPATFSVTGDPLGLCISGVYLEGDSRSQIIQGDFHVGGSVANELESPLIRILPALSGFVGSTEMDGFSPASLRLDDLPGDDDLEEDEEDDLPEPMGLVAISITPRRA